MDRALTMAFVGACFLTLSYMAMSVIGFYDGRHLILLGVIDIVLWILSKEE